MTGASLMGALFAGATGDVTVASAADVAAGMRITFAVAAGHVAVVLAFASRRRDDPDRRPTRLGSSARGRASGGGLAAE